MYVNLSRAWFYNGRFIPRASYTRTEAEADGLLLEVGGVLRLRALGELDRSQPEAHRP